MPDPLLQGLRVGCVPYLNALPLRPPSGVPLTLEPPSVLARLFRRNELDVALLPVFEVLQDPCPLLVDGVAIACDGPVFSVILAYRGALLELSEVWLDPASLSSVHLAKLLFAHFLRLNVEWRTGTPPPDAARVLIGDPAILFQMEHSEDWRIIDLGSAWKAHTQLPFVFAVWAVQPTLAHPDRAGDLVRSWKVSGLERREQIVESITDFPTDLVRRYLTESIRYDLGEREKRAMERYRIGLQRTRLSVSGDSERRFV